MNNRRRLTYRGQTYNDPMYTRLQELEDEIEDRGGRSMTKGQYKELCRIFGRELSAESLKKMGFSPLDGKFDEELSEDIHLYKVEQWRRKSRNDG